MIVIRAFRFVLALPFRVLAWLFFAVQVFGNGGAHLFHQIANAIEGTL